MLLCTTAASSTVNKLTLHNAEGADGKAMVGRADPPVSLNPQEGRGALECHLQGEQWREMRKTSKGKAAWPLIESPAIGRGRC